MTYLFRSLDEPPHLLSAMQLDVGFACFSVFCVGSSLATLALHVPEDAKSLEDANPSRGRLFKPKHVRTMVMVLAVLCFGLLGVGVFLPCMDLRMDLQLLYKNKPGLKALAPVLESYHIQELMHAEVSVWRCMCALAGWMSYGEMTAAIAFVMYAVFVVALTVIDMLVLVYASLHYDCQAVAISRKLKKLSMLDVSIMGIVVVVMSLRNLRSKGVIISIRYGLGVLLAAEICHYVGFHLVSSNARTPVQEEPAEKRTTHERGVSQV